MEASQEYLWFVERRRRLRERLAESGLAVDQWIEAHKESPSLGQLAALEGMLAQRRQQLSDLANLDDEFMNYLVNLRSKMGKS